MCFGVECSPERYIQETWLENTHRVCLRCSLSRSSSRSRSGNRGHVPEAAGPGSSSTLSRRGFSARTTFLETPLIPPQARPWYDQNDLSFISQYQVCFFLGDRVTPDLPENASSPKLFPSRLEKSGILRAHSDLLASCSPRCICSLMTAMF